ncbi:TetR/AcrR family transcriptional regulator [Plantactinospora endophytica]|uniref:TetR family transcriptional regulator n=1 Tax=Plantactinospora endophytica TaxID=673535 RepID=A0ABQ4E9E3_9ACTN|nr:TetR/AcrR family transcriptional regulator [Plantactinospora endophytica]GIG91296.1 TetR family transcriptional regulator [Plantactinospora endophytica]
MEPVPVPSRGGRPRDPQIDRAVLDATLAVLDDVGYVALTVEEVARRAGTTKPAIYRRFANRPRLVLAALAVRLGTARAPDTGCTLCDLHEGITIFVTLFDRIRPDVLAPLLADCASVTALRETFMTTLFTPPRAAVAEMVDRATARGDLRADVDRELVLDMLGALVHYRALFGHAATGSADVERAVEALLRGVATDYPALVAHSRRMAGTAPTHPSHP